MEKYFCLFKGVFRIVLENLWKIRDCQQFLLKHFLEAVSSGENGYYFVQQSVGKLEWHIVFEKKLFFFQTMFFILEKKLFFIKILFFFQFFFQKIIFNEFILLLKVVWV